MKKHLLLLLAVVSLAVGSVACSSKSSSDAEDSTVSEFCDLLKDYTKKIDAASSTFEISSINDAFENDVEKYKDDDTKLSKSEKKDIVDAFADLGIAIACKQAELMGESLSDADRAEAKKMTVEEMERLTSDCESISDYIAVFEEIGNGSSASSSSYEASSNAIAFADLIDDYAIKVSAANSESQIDALGDRFEADCARFENDNTYLSDSEKESIINALTGLVTAMGCKYAELQGNTVDVETQATIEAYSRNNIEQVTANCTTISEIISGVENMAD